MPKAEHYQQIYTHQAKRYHQMISPEDADGNLLVALESIASLSGQRILDLATGTGRFPLLYHGQAQSVVGLDLHGGMLLEHKIQRDKIGGVWPLLQGDGRSLPFKAASFEIITIGWALGHFPSWFGSAWATEIDRVLQEMERVLVPGGMMVIFETLGTGSDKPQPPHEGLARYYAWLEAERGFQRQKIQTDYQFASVAQAVAQTEFFFGPELAEKIKGNNWSRLPEWTGMWFKRASGRQGDRETGRLIFS